MSLFLRTSLKISCQSVPHLHIYRNKKYYSTIRDQFNESITQNKELMVKIIKQHKTFWKFTGGVVLFGVIGIYIYYDNIKAYLGKHGANVAETTMKNDNVKKGTFELSKQTLITLLNDKDVKDEAKKYLSDVIFDICQMEETQHKLSVLLVNSFSTEMVKQASKELAKNVLNDEEVIKCTTNFVKKIISEEDVRDSVKNNLEDVVQRMLKNEDFISSMAESVWLVTKQAFIPRYFINKKTC